MGWPSPRYSTMTSWACPAPLRSAASTDRTRPVAVQIAEGDGPDPAVDHVAPLELGRRLPGEARREARANQRYAALDERRPGSPRDPGDLEGAGLAVLDDPGGE